MAPHAQFQQVPPVLSFLNGHVDLGFENLGLPPQQWKALEAAFKSVGVAVPGTQFRLRYPLNAEFAVVEPATGQEPVLPPNWKRALYTISGNDFAYIGKSVRRHDQVHFEPANDPNYKDDGDGHSRVPQP